MPPGSRRPGRVSAGVLERGEVSAQNSLQHPHTHHMQGTAQVNTLGIPTQTSALRKPRIVFLLMSAVAKASTVDQLAHALPSHTVLVHHDFKQTPQFELSADNVRFVPEPVHTGWGQFSFVDGIFQGLMHALNELGFDYLQLLSPSCLPIKPLADFERHVSGRHDAHFDAIDLSQDLDAQLSVGYRAWTHEGSLAHRIARRLVKRYYGDSTGRRDEAGVWLLTGRGPSAWSVMAGWPLRAGARRLTDWRLGTKRLALHYGSVWFGARRPVVEGLVRAYRFARMHIAEEFLIPSLLMQLRPQRGPMNHLIARFDGAHPGVFGSGQLEALRRSPAWFARKFADALSSNSPRVPRFKEKPNGDGAWVNGEFFVLEPEVIELIEGDETVWEREPLEALAEQGQLAAFRHEGFWQPMDTLRDRQSLESLWSSGQAPWRRW